MIDTYEKLYSEANVADLAAHDVGVPAKEDFTCNCCVDAGTCEFAWDLYNTDGDCIADK